jgi:2,3,4,5-tetrahydropyridine-2-carboxylate N-succinyltransferase
MNNSESLRQRVVEFLARDPNPWQMADRELFLEFRQALEWGIVRAAVPGSECNQPHLSWVVQHWVKQAILMGFRHGILSDHSINPQLQPWLDKDTYPVQSFGLSQGVRIVPGGTTVRSGAHVAESVVIMPPSYVNVGAYIGARTMVDSHVLVGSCAQVGRDCHLSAGVQIGGVLEPVGALPVILEDHVFVGGNCGIFEGTIVQTGAILGAGVILTHSTAVYDLVQEKVLRPDHPDEPLIIPKGAVVVPGSRPAKSDFATSLGLHLACPVIVKYHEPNSGPIRHEDLLRAL